MLDNKIEELWPLTDVEDKYNSQGSKFFYAQIPKTESKFGHMSFLFYCADFTAEAAAP